MLSSESSSAKTWGATSTRPLTGSLAAWISAIDAPSLWPKSTGSEIPAPRRTWGSRSASSCMYRTGRGSGADAEEAPWFGRL